MAAKDTRDYQRRELIEFWEKQFGLDKRDAWECDRDHDHTLQFTLQREGNVLRAILQGEERNREEHDLGELVLEQVHPDYQCSGFSTLCANLWKAIRIHEGEIHRIRQADDCSYHLRSLQRTDNGRTVDDIEIYDQDQHDDVRSSYLRLAEKHRRRLFERGRIEDFVGEDTRALVDAEQWDELCARVAREQRNLRGHTIRITGLGALHAFYIPGRPLFSEKRASGEYCSHSPEQFLEDLERIARYQGPVFMSDALLLG